ncbi:tyrosine-type recombinase/integrase [Streptomyces qaidamensis]|uniref:tyrosine-type recombinase/integrase n=1 Tax=Streptomyces qaidamensis TaxID=1783515 RepID=UPI003653A027
MTITPRASGELTPASGQPGIELSASARERIRQSVPENTRRAYARQLDRFTAWCTEHDVAALPADPGTLTEYVNHLADLDQAPASIEQAIAAIRTAHRVSGYKGQPDTEGALRVLKAHRRERAEKGQSKRQAPPVTLDPLRSMVTAADPATLAGRRDRALLVLGFAMMARRSELAALRIEDLAFSDDGLTVTIRKSKTDQDAHGATVQIPHGVHPDTDPVRVTRAWLAALAEHDVTSGPLLRRINRWDQLQPGGMSGAAVNERVQRLAQLAGLEGAADFTAHGLRAGGPTEAAKAGHPVSFIAEHGRWSKNSPQVLEYIRAVDRWRDNPMRGIGL